jgi:hypothetical protein
VLDLVSRGRVADLGPTLAELVAGEQPFCLGYQPKCESHHATDWGAVYSVMCHDHGPARAPAEERRNGFDAAYAQSPLWDVCQSWPVDPAPGDADVRQPLRTSIPALVATGRYAAFADERLVREGLQGVRDLTVVVDPLAGHNVVSGTDCLLQIRNTWLDDLATTDDDLACVDDLRMDWVLDPNRLIVPDASTPGAE